MLSCINILSPEIQTPDSDFCDKLPAEYAERAVAKLLKILLKNPSFLLFISTANHKICSNYTCNESGSLCSLHLWLNTAFRFSLEKVPLTGIAAVCQEANQDRSSSFSRFCFKRLFWVSMSCFVFQKWRSQDFPQGLFLSLVSYLNLYHRKNTVQT